MAIPTKILAEAAEAAQKAGDHAAHAELAGLTLKAEEIAAYAERITGRYSGRLGDIVYGCRQLGRDSIPD